MTDQFADATSPALILGNGPSLRHLDFSEVSGYATFGMNAAYRYWQDIQWWPDYYSCLDLVVGDSHRDAIAHLASQAARFGIRQLLLRHALIRSLGKQLDRRRVTCYEMLLADLKIPKLPDVTTGSHTVLWAESLGYETILLAGVDCNYLERVPGSEEMDGHLTIRSEQANPNYFFPGYQQPGDRYNAPNPRPNLHLKSWSNVACHLDPFTVVVNLNKDSRLEAFDKNSSADSMLAVGTRIPHAAAEPATTLPGAPAFGRAAHGLERRIWYRSAEQLRAQIEARLTGGDSHLAQRWRSAFGGKYLDMSVRPEAGTTTSGDTRAAGCVAIRFADPGAPTPEIHVLSVRLLDDSRTSQFKKLLVFLSDRLETSRSRFFHRSWAVIRNPLWSLLPWRLRAARLSALVRLPWAMILRSVGGRSGRPRN